MKALHSGDWAQIEHRYKAYDYILQHHLSHKKAVAQSQKLHYRVTALAVQSLIQDLLIESYAKHSGYWVNKTASFLRNEHDEKRLRE